MTNNKNNKPKAALIGADGNIFNLIGIASRSLRNQGMHQEAREMAERIKRMHMIIMKHLE